MEKQCEQTLLARGVVSEVMYCSHCRVFHVNVGALTVHFEAAALRDLRDTLSAALAAHECLTGSELAEIATPPAGMKTHGERYLQASAGAGLRNGVLRVLTGGKPT